MNELNVYRFAATGKEPKIVVAPNVAEASKAVDFEWDTIKCVYKNVTVVDNG